MCTSMDWEYRMRKKTKTEYMCDIEHAIGHFLFKFISVIPNASISPPPSRANLSFYLFHLFELTFSMVSALFSDGMQMKPKSHDSIDILFGIVWCVRLCDFKE